MILPTINIQDVFFLKYLFIVENEVRHFQIKFPNLSTIEIAMQSTPCIIVYLQY
jgi:hypothetical protein